jgi:hypothetical protein
MIARNYVTMLSIDPEYYNVVLQEGEHTNRDDGMCLMEWLAYLAGEPHSDNPRCVSHVIGAVGRPLNDTLPEDYRQMLKMPSLEALGTAGDDLDKNRAYLAVDWMTRTWLPLWLDLLHPHHAAAAWLRDSAPVTDFTRAESALRTIVDIDRNIVSMGYHPEATAVFYPMSWISDFVWRLADSVSAAFIIMPEASSVWDSPSCDPFTQITKEQERISELGNALWSVAFRVTWWAVESSLSREFSAVNKFALIDKARLLTIDLYAKLVKGSLPE